MMKKNITDKIVGYVFKTSNQPILFKDLLSANSHFNEGMHVDGGKLGFRMSIIRAYVAYFMICALIVMPLIGITHYFLKHLNFHISILSTIIVTSAVFIGFNFFQAWIRDIITYKQIKKGWAVHFPFFAYEKYNKKVEEIYNDAIKKEIPKKDLEQYVLDAIVKES
jgi:hypothetical protein